MQKGKLKIKNASVWALSVVAGIILFALIWNNRALEPDVFRELFQQFVPLVLIALLMSFAFEALTKRSWGKFVLAMSFSSMAIWVLIAVIYSGKNVKSVEFPVTLLSNKETGGFFDNEIFEEYLDVTSRGFSGAQKDGEANPIVPPDARGAVHSQVVLYSLLNEIAALHSNFGGGRTKVDINLATSVTRPVTRAQLKLTDVDVVNSTSMLRSLPMEFFQRAIPFRWPAFYLPKGMRIIPKSLGEKGGSIEFVHPLVTVRISISDGIPDWPSEYSWRSRVNVQHQRKREKLFRNTRGEQADLTTYRVQYTARYSPWYIGSPKMAEIKAWESYLREEIQYTFDFRKVVARLVDNGVITENDFIYRGDYSRRE